MNFITKLFCSHNFIFHGWSYVRCKKCGIVKENVSMNAKLQNEYWEKIRGENPVFSKENINIELLKRGRNSHIQK